MVFTSPVTDRDCSGRAHVAPRPGAQREGARRSARERKDPVSGGACWGLASYALPLAEHRDALAAEVARLRKLFDDAGLGEYDIHALVDHYQAEAIEARAEVARLREALEASEARGVKAAEACEALETLVDYSSRTFHDSTRWESEDDTAPLWQAWRNWAYDAIKAAKGAGR